MKSKQLLLLVGLFAVLAGGAFLIRSGGEGSHGDQVKRGTSIVDETVYDRVAQVVVTQGQEVQHLAMEEGQWLVRSMGGYPADFSLVKQHVVALSQLEVGQVIRGGATNPEEFGLGADQAITIALQDEQGEVLATLALGNARTGGGGRYVRAGEGDVVLVSDGLTSFPSRNTAWVAPQLVHVNGSDLAYIESAVSNTVSRIGVGADNTFTLEGLPDGKQVDPAKAGQLARALQYVNFDNVAPKDATDASLGLADPVTWKGTAQDGVVYSMSVGSKSAQGGAWVKLGVEASIGAAPERGDLDEAAWEQAQAAHEAKGAAAKSTVEEFQAKTAWRFHLPSHNAGNFRVPRSELVADIPQSEAVPAPAGAVGPDLNGAVQQAIRSVTSEQKPAARVVTEPVEVPPAK